jgi:hypothetical protein
MHHDEAQTSSASLAKDTDDVDETLHSTNALALKDSNNNNSNPSFKQQEIFIDSKKSPAICQLFDGKEMVPAWQLHAAAFGELVALFGNTNSVDWTYANCYTGERQG